MQDQYFCIFCELAWAPIVQNASKCCNQTHNFTFYLVRFHALNTIFKFFEIHQKSKKTKLELTINTSEHAEKINSNFVISI